MMAERVLLLEAATSDLAEAVDFYENQKRDLGGYFFDSLMMDIESLGQSAGIHSIHYGCHRMLARNFPFAIYYDLSEDIARVVAILDMRRDPAWIRKRLTSNR